jgi:hypothetical protein
MNLGKIPLALAPARAVKPKTRFERIVLFIRPDPV